MNGLFHAAGIRERLAGNAHMQRHQVFVGLHHGHHQSPPRIVGEGGGIYVARHLQPA